MNSEILENWDADVIVLNVLIRDVQVPYKGYTLVKVIPVKLTKIISGI